MLTQRNPTLQELRNPIRQAAAAAITPETLRHVFRATADKWEVCRDVGGRHLESNH